MAVHLDGNKEIDNTWLESVSSSKRFFSLLLSLFIAEYVSLESELSSLSGGA